MFDHSVVPVVAGPEPGRKFFSVHEANRALPYVSRVVADIAETYVQIIELRRELENLDDGALRNLTDREYETTMDRLGGLVDELHMTGAELRDFELGRVDFPAVYDNRPIMLTWESGKAEVSQWHHIDDDDESLYPVEELQINIHASLPATKLPRQQAG